MIIVILDVKDKTHTFGIDDDMPLLWVLREIIKLTGTKFGCGISPSGACTVHLDGQAIFEAAMIKGDR